MNKFFIDVNLIREKRGLTRFNHSPVTVASDGWNAFQNNLLNLSLVTPNGLRKVTDTFLTNWTIEHPMNIRKESCVFCNFSANVLILRRKVSVPG